MPNPLSTRLSLPDLHNNITIHPSNTEFIHSKEARDKPILKQSIMSTEGSLAEPWFIFLNAPTHADQSLVLSVRPLGGRLVATGDDAGNLSAFSLPDSTQSLPIKQNATLLFKHPKTVWAVAPLPGFGRPGSIGSAGGDDVADIATGSADHMIRVFTPDARRALHGDNLREVEKASQFR